MSTMDGGLHYMFHCSGCGSAIQLPLETLGQAFGPRAVRAKDKEPVAVVCSRCTNARNYDLAMVTENPPWGPLVNVRHTSDWELVGQLECEEESCDILLPLFAPVKRPATFEEWKEYVSTWKWDDLKCAEGHKILEPQLQTPANE